MSRIFVCGDTHGSHDIHKVTTKAWKEQRQLTKEDVLIQLGDWGGIWYPIGINKDQEYWLDWWAESRYTLAVVLGNHENYDVIDQLPWVEKWGGKVQILERQLGEIYFLERGGIYTINGKKILAISGGLSIDKSGRLPGVSWWAQEDITMEEIETTLDNMSKHANRVDYLLTHTCPQSKIPVFTDRPGKTYHCTTATFVEHVSSILEFKEHHFGHLHTDMTEGRLTCHYNGEPKELL